MMKKMFSFLLAGYVCIMLSASCFAMEFTNPPVVDDARYLTEEEFVSLTEKLETIRQNYEFEVAIVTEYAMTSKDAMSSADDIYDYRGYGAGEADDGILFYICASTREYHISTHADGLRVFNENGIAYLQKNIEPYLIEDDYYSAMLTFADLSEDLLQMAKEGEPFNERQLDLTYILIVIGCALIFPFVIAYSLMNKKLYKMKTAVSNDYAANYIKPGSMRVDASRDMFLYSHVVKTEKPKSDNSGSHTSSSGRTHGGGGGSF